LYNSLFFPIINKGVFVIIKSYAFCKIAQVKMGPFWNQVASYAVL